MAFLTVSSSPRNFIETIGFMFSSSSYTEGVAVGGNQHLLAFFDLGHNHLVPIRKGPGYGQFERLKHGELFWLRLILIPLILDNVFIVGVISFHRRRWYVK